MGLSLSMRSGSGGPGAGESVEGVQDVRTPGGADDPVPDGAGGVQEQDEVGWGKWITENHKLVVLAARAVVHHYTFFNQQDWLDRSSLLEDLRAANVPVTAWERSGPGRALPRLGRILRQIPAILRRRADVALKKLRPPPAGPNTGAA